jgi:hypothetical protein
VYRLLVGMPEGKRLLEKLRRRWVTNIKVDLRDVGCGLDWFASGYGQVESSTKPSSSINCWKTVRLPHNCLHLE